jgi:cell division topological specificity factor
MDLFKMFSQKPSPRDVAKQRLKVILIHDRSSVSPELLDAIKEDILKVLSKYVEIDSGEIDVKITKMEEIEGDSPALIASIPIKRMRIDR